MDEISGDINQSTHSTIAHNRENSAKRLPSGLKRLYKHYQRDPEGNWDIKIDKDKVQTATLEAQM